MGDAPDMISLDFDLDDVSSGFSAVPGAQYVLTVDSVKIKESQKGDEYLSVQYNIENEEVFDPDSQQGIAVKGRKVFDNVFFSSKENSWKLAQLLKNSGYVWNKGADGNSSFDPNGLVGLQVGAVVVRVPVVEDGQVTSETRNNIKRYIDVADVETV